MTHEITIRRPSDFHEHFRQGDTVDVVARLVWARFAYALAMPNTVPPVTSHSQARDYRERIKRGAPRGREAVMTLYMCDDLDVGEVEDCCLEAWFAGVKYYPRGLTTNSGAGLLEPSGMWRRGARAHRVLEVLREHDRVLLLHAADGVDARGVELDPYDQERHFVKETLPRIRDAHPELRISLEHVSTRWGADAVHAYGGSRFGCSLTAHHLLLDRRDAMRGGMHPQRFWWPVIQPPEHKEALHDLVRNRLSYVWLGTDSAPHPSSRKYADCCAGGVLTAHAGIELYAEAFEGIGALDYLEAFASLNGPAFYGYVAPADTITLRREPWTVRGTFMADGGDDDPIVPFRLGEEVAWRIVT